MSATSATFCANRSVVSTAISTPISVRTSRSLQTADFRGPLCHREPAVDDPPAYTQNLDKEPLYRCPDTNCELQFKDLTAAISHFEGGKCRAMAAGKAVKLLIHIARGKGPIQC
jgi:hypothetical protein